jgi:hypothetical protein
MLRQYLLPDVHLPRAFFSAARSHVWARHLAACVRRTLCGMRGHDLVLHFEPRRMSLQCVDCGWESSGWTIDRPRFLSSNARYRVLSGRTSNRIERRFMEQTVRGEHPRVANQAATTREVERLAG